MDEMMQGNMVETVEENQKKGLGIAAIIIGAFSILHSVLCLFWSRLAVFYHWCDFFDHLSGKGNRFWQDVRNHRNYPQWNRFFAGSLYGNRIYPHD